MMRKIIFTLVAGLLSAIGAQAAGIAWTGGGSDTEWSTVANWDANDLPGATGVDRAIIGNGDHATATRAVTSDYDVDLDVQHVSSALDISADLGKLRKLWLRNGTVTQTAGAVNFKDTDSDSYIGTGGTAMWAISGGSYAMRGDLAVNAGGTFSVIGSSATVSVGNGSGDNLTLAGTGKLNFTMDASGVSAIAVSGTFTVDADNSRLTIDASAYTGGSTIIDLVTFGANSTQFAAGNVEVTVNVFKIKSWSVGYDADSMFLSLVPYAPGETVLIGQDDFDGTETHLSKDNSDWKNQGALVWASVNRETVKEAGIIDTSVAAGGVINYWAGDTLGFLGTNKTDKMFGMYRGAAGGTRTLTYTFDIDGCEGLNMTFDLAASGDIIDPGIKMTYSIDGAGETTILTVGRSTTDWTETMDNDTAVNRNNSASVTLNGVLVNSLTDTFQNYNPVIAGKGSVLTVTLSMANGNGGHAYGLDNLKLFRTVPSPTSSGIDLRAYQAADGVYVEFVAYDVESDGTIRLALMDESGGVVWQGDTAVTAGPQFVARFLVPGLEPGGRYDFQVRDEVGKWWEANGVTVGTFETAMTGATLTGLTLTFDSLPEHDYEIQWLEELGGTWQTVTNVSAAGEQTSVVVDYPNPSTPSGFFRVRAK